MAPATSCWRGLGRPRRRTALRDAWVGTGVNLSGDELVATVSGRKSSGLTLGPMAKIESKHDVRRKVREAQAQVNRERLQRESDNREDMVGFLVAEQKLTAVDTWEAERHEQVRAEANQRRLEQRMEGARALGRVRDRGESIASIAQLGQCSEKTVRTYLRLLRAKSPAAARNGKSGSGALGSPAEPSGGNPSDASTNGGDGHAVAPDSGAPELGETMPDAQHSGRVGGPR